MLYNQLGFFVLKISSLSENRFNILRQKCSPLSEDAPTKKKEIELGSQKKKRKSGLLPKSEF